MSASSEEADYEEDTLVEPQQPTNRTSQDASFDPSVQSTKPTIPLQKRRRVTRACDECRRKKIKCDGKQPCTHCQVYSYDCTYDQPSNRRRNPAPQYVEHLENRLQRAEALLKTVLPDVDLEDQKGILDMPQHMCSPIKSELQPPPPRQGGSQAALENYHQGSDSEKDSMLESMVANTGLLDLDDKGNWDFHGHSSGRVFLRKMREQFGDLMGREHPEKQSSPFMKSRVDRSSKGVPQSAVESPLVPRPISTDDLPAKNCAMLLSQNALDDAGAIVRLVHQPSYYAMLDRVYDRPRQNYGEEETSFIPLLYSVLALGALFAKAEQSELQTNGYANAIDQGFKWFRCSRSMIDLTDVRDLAGLQTVMYMILFLQCSARLRIHRSIPNVFNPIETELRKRIFWAIRKLDIYVGALLGLPQMLSDDDIDQEWPLEIDDEYLTKDKIEPMPSGKLSIFAAFNVHTRLVGILSKAVKYVYPIKGKGQIGAKNGQSYVVSHARIREIEQDLQAWMENLPMPFRPGEETSNPKFMRMRHILRMAYAHIQMFLYRPFLHYISRTVPSRRVDKRSYACAAACISVSRNIVHLTGEMKRRGLLVGSYWFYMYTTFFAIISLIFFALENAQSAMIEDILKDAYEGKDTLSSLAKNSLAADRCSTTLNEIMDQLPAKIHLARNTASSKKRSEDSHNSSLQRIRNGSDSKSGMANNNIAPRLATFPTQLNGWQRSSVSQPAGLRQLVPHINPEYHQPSQDQYSPLNSNSANMGTPNNGESSLQSRADSGQGLGMSKLSNGQAIPDLSAMMFPSSDPFAYPNQPVTALENRHSIKQEDNSSMNPNMYNLGAPNSTDSPYDKLEPQMFGQIPSYMMQGEQPESVMHNMQEAISMSGADPTSTAMSMQSNEALTWPEQHQRSGVPPGVDLDSLYGEDWGSWMNQGYRQ